MLTEKKFKIVFLKETIIELQKDIDYYNEKKAGLGKQFGIAVQKTSRKLTKNPFFSDSL